MSQLGFNIAGDPSDDRPILVADNPAGGTVIDSGYFEGVPRNRYVIVVPPELWGGAWLYYHWGTKAVRVILPPGDGQYEAGAPPCQPPEDPPVAMYYDPPPPAMPEVWAVGQFFQLANGEPYFGAGASSFALQQKFDHGDADARAVLEQWKGFGYDEVRVFTRYNGGLGFYPGNLDTIRPLADLALSCGMRIEYVVSADHAAFGWSDDQEVAWWNSVNERVAGTVNVSLEGVNEGNHEANRFDGIVRFANPSVLASRGSGISDGGTMLPVFRGPRGYATYHPGRSKDFPRKVGHNAYDDVAKEENVATKSNEINRPDENAAKPEDYFDAAADAAIMITAATFHSNEGKKAELLTNPHTIACAQEFIAGARAVDLRYRPGHYTAGHLHDCPIDNVGLPSYSRIHGRILGGLSVCVITQRPANYVVHPKDGWQIIEQNRSIVYLGR